MGLVRVTDSLLVSEVFGPTIQGEGPHMGRTVGFVRLGLCNLDCSWCDTPYTWDWTGKNGPPQDRSALAHMTADEIIDLLTPMKVNRVVITGGEPLVQRTALGPLVQSLTEQGYAVEIETNGTLVPTDHLLRLVDHWNVSPKLSSSGVASDKAWKLNVVDELTNRAHGTVALKFVCRTVEDVDTVASLALIAGSPNDVWIMPEGTDAATVVRHTEAIADRTVVQGFNLSTRLHVLAWGNKRGV